MEEKWNLKKWTKKDDEEWHLFHEGEDDVEETN
jgi:hypothetical protein